MSNLFSSPNFIPVNTRHSLPPMTQPINRMLPQHNQRRNSMPHSQVDNGMNSYYEQRSGLSLIAIK